MSGSAESVTSSVRAASGAAIDVRLANNLLVMVHQDETNVLVVDLHRLDVLISSLAVQILHNINSYADNHEEVEPQKIVLVRHNRFDRWITPSTFEEPQGFSSLHPQKLQALFVQSYGIRNPQVCERCARAHTDGPFVWCVSASPVGNRACGNCLWQQDALGCSCKCFSPSYDKGSAN